jgi:hypothetical protein
MLADSTTLDHENISNGSVAYGVPVGSAVFEPNVEARAWMQPGASTSFMGTFGVRLQMGVAGFSVLPAVGYSIGKLAAQEASGLNTTANLTGFHGTLTIRVR